MEQLLVDLSARHFLWSNWGTQYLTLRQGKRENKMKVLSKQIFNSEYNKNFMILGKLWI